MSNASDRDHALDFLRAAMMFLGILLHGMLSFTSSPIPFWPAHDADTSKAADVFVVIVHEFRMQTFFLLAGFFGCLLYSRYSLGGLLRHRFTRLVIPFGLALLIIQPTLQALWILGDHSALRAVGIPVDGDASRLELLRKQFLSGAFLESIYPFHLWFLYFLILFFIAMVPLVAIGGALSRTKVAEKWDHLFGAVLERPLVAVPLFALLTMPLVWSMQVWGMVDTPNKWFLPPHLLGYYFAFFLAGWLIYRQRASLPAFVRRWRSALLVGNLVVLPIYLVMALEMFKAKLEHTPPREELRVGISIACVLYTWLMVNGLIGLFQSLFHGHRPWVRYLADASYWCYLWHLTPIVALQILLADSPLPGLLKFAIVVGGSLAILLASYEWCVRYTFIGVILNGRKYRPHPVVPKPTEMTWRPPAPLS